MPCLLGKGKQRTQVAGCCTARAYLPPSPPAGRVAALQRPGAKARLCVVGKKRLPSARRHEVRGQARQGCVGG